MIISQVGPKNMRKVYKYLTNKDPTNVRRLITGLLYVLSFIKSYEKEIMAQNYHTYGFKIPFLQGALPMFANAQSACNYYHLWDRVFQINNKSDSQKILKEEYEKLSKT